MNLHLIKNEYKLMLKPWISKGILDKCKIRDSILKSISSEPDSGRRIILYNEYKK